MTPPFSMVQKPLCSPTPHLTTKHSPNPAILHTQHPKTHVSQRLQQPSVTSHDASDQPAGSPPGRCTCHVRTSHPRPRHTLTCSESAKQSSHEESL
ncbi:hypothetical protein EJ04DRAFT_508391 [Polyplosphaeria fusca]|uniref:Uncharacterized protein n=1 Tax=Polyplosphaeria fusca TaxID=682080 RepID=A0A9P4RBF9_9PLEO|nr:hypothetical protein EJ04DRAFT_508391 [Polyplosphaeria fusca]